MKIDFAREIALKIIYDIDVNNAYSNIALDEYLNKNRERLSIKDINLISEIVYGIVGRRITIDTIIQEYSKIKINKISKWILNILRIGAYQILFLDKIPKSAAVNESVNLAKKYGYRSVNFVNAILRRIEKSDYYELEKIDNDIDRMSKLYSVPEWIVEKFLNQYDIEVTNKICKNSVLKPKLTIRINTLKTTKQEIIKILEQKNIEYKETILEDFLYLEKVKNISELDLFKKGLITVQDIGAGKIPLVVNPKENEVILDACSAPGGKTTYLAQLMNNKGKVIAWDVHSHRVKLVEQTANRMGINIIETYTNDATIFKEELVEKFDKILLDVPCLGLGVMKRKPDIKWQRKQEDIEQINLIQKKILENGLKYLKVDGELVYSTCSIIKEENEEIIQEVLKDTTQYKLIMEETILPNELEDGFYIAKIKKCSITL